MSDGNFNRALLPSTPYASGIKAGRAQGKQWALQAFDEWLHTTFTNIDAATADAYRSAYMGCYRKQEPR